MEHQFTLLLTFLLFLFMILEGCRSRFQYGNSKLPPGPRNKLPLIGHLHHLRGLQHHKLRDLSKKHGPLMFLQLGEVGTVVASSAEVAKEMMKTQDLLFVDRPLVLFSKILSYGAVGIIFTSYGEYWRQMKKICIMELLSAKRVQSFSRLREEEVTNLIKLISSMAGAGSPINLSEKIFSLTNDITARAAFGKKCNERDSFLPLMHEFVHLAGSLSIPDLFPSLKFLHGISPAKHKLEKIHKKMDKILDDIIHDHEHGHGVQNMHKEEDLVDVLLRLKNNHELEFPIKNENIKAVILDLFAAGTDTSSTTLEWAFSEMIKNPRVMEKAQSEVRHALDGKRQVSDLDMSQLKYISSVIKETLRLHPPAPLLAPRQTREKCEIRGYEIPKKTRVIVNAWAMGRDPEYWKDPESFAPERFEGLSIDYRGNDFEYIPFGAGRRMCPGISFAVANMEPLLAQLLYHFDWKLPNGVKPEEFDMSEVFGASVRRKSELYLIPTPYMPSSGS